MSLKINNCCGEKPRALKSDPLDPEARFDYELIECLVCKRIVYGCDDEEIEQWNSGWNDG